MDYYPKWRALKYAIGALEFISGCFMLIAIQRLNNSIKRMNELKEMFN